MALKYDDIKDPILKKKIDQSAHGLILPFWFPKNAI